MGFLLGLLNEGYCFLLPGPDISEAFHTSLKDLCNLALPGFANTHTCGSARSYARPWVHPESMHRPQASCPISSSDLRSSQFMVSSSLPSAASNSLANHTQSLNNVTKSKVIQKIDFNRRYDRLWWSGAKVRKECQSACLHTSGLLLHLFPLISHIWSSLIYCEAPLSLFLPLPLQSVICFVDSLNPFKTSQTKFYTQQILTQISYSRFFSSLSDPWQPCLLTCVVGFFSGLPASDQRALIFVNVSII